MPSTPSPTVEASGLPWSALIRLIRLPNQTGTYLLMLPTLWSLVLATEGVPPPPLVAIFIAGSFLMRSAGVILNDLADQSFDRQVVRTKTRPLASGELSRRHALALLSVLLLMAGSLLWLLDPVVTWLAPGAFALASLYPFAKRWIQIPQAVLGLAFGWGTIMAWAAVRGQLDAPVWCLFGATAAWAVAYDTIYAIQDRDDDRRIGVKSSAIFFGRLLPLGVGVAYCLMILLLGLAGWLVQIRWPYYVALLGVGLFLFLQTVQLRKPIEPAVAFGMFRAHTWVGAAVLAGLLAGFIG
ncbi:4-hydroxybenzoate octaprenyltransferase [Candidatus Nitrospira inopinata]|uniref:4-hydroxybenzoate octaprenyltransferase n=1 Tax=Candidatus Nitrospira inopinata TaxID=1715989 RepID=A0A0S4KS48_9BACT|nr:4-hydroxybenzoate octaprenyltransferase [Candidatus Nitrospira inopinata]CUQ66575.1 4-hydroxybenzoate octaprenyltransferase [Candidatus Nitrospira inopinata]